VVVKPGTRTKSRSTAVSAYGVDHLEVTGDAANLSVVVKLPKHSHNSGESDLR